MGSQADAGLASVDRARTDRVGLYRRSSGIVFAEIEPECMSGSRSKVNWAEHLVRVYRLGEETTVRLDATTGTVNHDPDNACAFPSWEGQEWAV